VVIRTERLILRDWRDEDIAPFIRHTNTAPVMRWLGGVQTEEKQRDAIENRIMRWQRELGFTFWAVERQADGELLGFCGLKLADAEPSPDLGVHEIGWRLREDAWGLGYAKEAAVASLDFAFDKLAVDRVVAFTCIQNEPSWGLMERLGMTRRPDRDYHDPRFGAELNPAIVYDIRPGELKR
jgi:RimJ/RimL family protein N-acetyltransferase